ncbi:hypothetical protein [Paenibacillus sp. MBLB4367]|uniref:hypothetical protein n=1 Tax=Paenibacillus sp. MBLB4367 TaxID=3384767 RepID=UPI0039082BB7
MARRTAILAIAAMWIGAVGSGLLSPGRVQAAGIAKTETVKLTETMTYVQLVVTGTADDFDVDLTMPDGSKEPHKQEDMSKAMYFTFDNKRSWLIYEAAAGEYKLDIQSGSDQTFQVSVKKEIAMPITTWEAPANANVQVTNGTELKLSWKVAGEPRPDQDIIRFSLKPAGGWDAMPLGEAPLVKGAASLTVPAAVADGQYELHAVADNRTAAPQQIDPKVTVTVARGNNPPTLKLMETSKHGGTIDFDFQAPNGLAWQGIDVRIVGDAKDSKPAVYKVAKEELYTVDDKRGSDYTVYRWSLSVPGSGGYKGSFQVISQGGILGPVQPITPFQAVIRDWSKDAVKWSVENDATNRRNVEVSLSLQKDSRVQVERGKNMLFDGQVKAGDKAPTVISVPLEEGDGLYNVLVGDDDGNVNTYSKRYIADFTPPRLQMIQPMAEHPKLQGGFASGFTEPGATVRIGKVELKTGPDGYFKAEKIGSSLDLTVTDESGNETSYHWRAQSKWSKQAAFFAGVNGLIAGAAVFLIVRLRRTSKRK